MATETRGFTRRLVDRILRRRDRQPPQRARPHPLERADVLARITSKGGNVPRPEIARRRRRNKAARMARRQNRGR